MTYGFHDDLTKAWVAEIYPLSTTLSFSNQTSKTVTMDIPNGWTGAETIVASIGLHVSTGGANGYDIYGDLNGSSVYGDFQRRVSISSENKISITLRAPSAYTGDITVTVLLVRT